MARAQKNGPMPSPIAPDLMVAGPRPPILRFRPRSPARRTPCASRPRPPSAPAGIKTISEVYPLIMLAFCYRIGALPPHYFSGVAARRACPVRIRWNTDVEACASARILAQRHVPAGGASGRGKDNTDSSTGRPDEADRGRPASVASTARPGHARPQQDAAPTRAAPAHEPGGTLNRAKNEVQ